MPLLRLLGYLSCGKGSLDAMWGCGALDENPETQKFVCGAQERT